MKMIYEEEKEPTTNVSLHVRVTTKQHMDAARKVAERKVPGKPRIKFAAMLEQAINEFCDELMRSADRSRSSVNGTAPTPES